MLYQVGFCHVRLRTNHLHWNLHRNQVIQKRYVNACLKHFYRQTISIQNTETVLHKRGKTSSNMEFSFKNVITKISILIRAKKSSGRVSSQASLNQHHSVISIYQYVLVVHHMKMREKINRQIFNNVLFSSIILPIPIPYPYPFQACFFKSSLSVL